MQGKSEVIAIRSEPDLLLARRMVRDSAIELGFTLLAQTKVVTATAELARNTLIHGGGGKMRLETLVDGERRGIRLTFEDRGPGIPDIEQALTDGFSTGKGLGLGLSGSRRIMSEFEIEARPEGGTRVMVIKWT